MFFQAWNSTDLDGLVALLAPQVTGRNPLFEGDVTLTWEAEALSQMIGEGNGGDRLVQ